MQELEKWGKCKEPSLWGPESFLDVACWLCTHVYCIHEN